MLHAHPVPATRTAPFAQAHPRRRSLLAAIAVLALLGVSHPSMSQLLSTSGRWTPTSPGLDSAGVTGTAVHMTLLRGDDDWQSVSGHYHSYLLWYQDRHDLCGATTFFTGALYGWNPGYNANCSDSMMNSGFTLLPLNSPLDPGYDVFCSNTTSLADGRLLTIGGASAENSGVSQTSVFDRTITSGNRWTKMNPMATPRWYPGIKQMGDNSVVAYAGLRYARMHVLGGRSSVGGSMRTDVGRQRLTDVGPWDVDVLPAEDAGVTVGAKQPDSREYAVSPLQKINSGLSRAIVFGGKDAAGSIRSDVWGLLHKTDGGGDRLEWWKYTTITGAFLPPGLWKHVGVVDSATTKTVPNGRLWLACGLKADGNPNDYVYSGQQDTAASGRAWNWTRHLLPGGPGPRSMASYAYDARYNRMIVFGGYDDTGAVADNEVYALNLDATNPTWTKLTCVDTISSSRPVRLAEAGLGEGPTDAEHLNLGKSPNMYMYGGVDSLGSLHGDVWLMYFPRPTTVSWYKLPIDSTKLAPYPRRGPIVIRDHDSWNLRIFGGAKSAAVSLDTTWMIDVYRNESVPSCDNQPRAWVAQGVHSGGGAVGAVGFPDPFEIPANTVERITPPTSGAGSWAGLPSSSDRFEHFYPLLFALPNGKLFDATARLNGRPTFTLDLGSGVWSQFPASATPTSLLALEGGSAVSRVLLDRTYEIMKCGSKDQESGTALGLAARLQIAPNGSTTGWTAASTGADTMIGRVYHNLVTLPNGRVLVTGGAKKIDFTASSSNSLPVYRPQIWDPVANTWTDTLTLAKETTARGYHSTALLMPDARVLTGGGNDAVNGNLDKHKFRVFCPPYHFAGNNPAVAPVIDDGPTTVQYNSTIFVQTSATVAQVCLIRPGSVTHGFNPDQHYIELTFTQCGCGLYAFAPTAAYAPPGDYLLFLVNAAGVPSLGKWVRLGTAPTVGDAACDFSECFGGGSGGGGGGGGYLDGGLVANRGVGPLVASSTTITSNALYSDNTLFAGSPDGSIVRDRLALPNGPLATGTTLRVRLRHFGAGRDEYSRVRLVAIDHGQATDAVAG
ncbi:MAG: DUF1929 domain-containing protein, partial [Candidatus Eisenbacteria bacterium]|nr:DUF1929 domain-containing protein [Candidatus Eisenbacteria bacterium]